MKKNFGKAIRIFLIDVFHLSIKKPIIRDKSTIKRNRMFVMFLMNKKRRR